MLYDKDLVLGAAQEMEGLELYYKEFAEASDEYTKLYNRVKAGHYRNFFGRFVFASMFLFVFGKVSIFLIRLLPVFMQNIIIGPKELVITTIVRVLFLMVLAGVFVPDLYLPGVFASFVYSNKMDRLQRKMDEIIQFASEEIEETQYLKNIPEKYIFPQGIYAFREYFENRRADTLKEAINLLEREEYFREMERRQNQMMDSANVASKYAGIAAGFSAANLLLKI